MLGYKLLKERHSNFTVLMSLRMNRNIDVNQFQMFKLFNCVVELRLPIG